jgi:hypothetical protein
MPCLRLPHWRAAPSDYSHGKAQRDDRNFHQVASQQPISRDC